MIYNGDLSYENHFQFIKKNSFVQVNKFIIKSIDDSNSNNSSYLEDYAILNNSFRKKITSMKKKEKFVEQTNVNGLNLIKTEYYKNPDINSISSSTIQLEENIKRYDENIAKLNLKAISDELIKLTISLPSTYNDKRIIDIINKIHDEIKDLDEAFYEVIIDID